MQKLIFSIVVCILFLSAAMAQVSVVEEAQRYRSNINQTILESDASTLPGNESLRANSMIHLRSNSQLEELGSRYIFVR